MSTRPIRRRFLHRLVREFGAHAVRRIAHAGSRSMIALGHDAAILLRAGRLDRERRIFTALRRTDVLALQRRKRSAICFLIPELGEPLVVPVRELVAHAAATADPIRIHIRVGARGEVRLLESGRDLRRYSGWTHLRRLRPREPRAAATPALSHAQWQTAVAAIGHRLGKAVWVPPADHAALDPALAGGRRVLTDVDVLPPAAAGIDSLRYADVVLTQPGAPWPELVCEVEHGGDVTAALRRCAETLEELRRLGADPLPRFAIVADTGRRAEYERKLRGALLRPDGARGAVHVLRRTRRSGSPHRWLRTAHANGPIDGMGQGIVESTD